MLLLGTYSARVIRHSIGQAGMRSQRQVQCRPAATGNALVVGRNSTSMLASRGAHIYSCHLMDSRNCEQATRAHHCTHLGAFAATPSSRVYAWKHIVLVCFAINVSLCFCVFLNVLLEPIFSLIHVLVIAMDQD